MTTNNIAWWFGVVLIVMFLLKIGRRLVKAFVLILLVIAALLIAPKAFAAEAKPWTACGSTVTFVAMQSHGAPDGVAAAVAAAYAEVGPVAGLTVMVESGGNPGSATASWAWSDPLAGITYPDGDTSDVNGMSGVEARVHQHSATAPMSGPALKTLLLRDIGRDLGLPRLQATGGHLTKADKTALKAACKAQATSALSTPTPAAAGVTAAPDGARGVDVARTATAPARVTISPREKVIGYGGAGAAGIVLALTLFGGRIRNLATGRGVKVPSLAGIRDWIKGLLRRPSKAKTQ